MQSTPPLTPIDELRADVNRMLESIHPENAIAATVVFQVNPSKEEQFASNAIRLTAATRQLPGCNLFYFHRAVRPATPNALEYFIYEDWQTRRQFQRQWNSTHLMQFQATVGDLISAAPNLRFYTGWRRTEAPATSDLVPDFTGLLLLPLQLSVRGMREVARFFGPSAPPVERGPARPVETQAPTRTAVTPQGTPAPRPSRGWGPIPYPVPSTGQQVSAPSIVSTPRGGAAISDEFPFEANYVDIDGSRMHYVDEGRGDPILLLHGNPTWSYTWRNIIPHLTAHGRCIAPDLIGFGRSSKPDIEYRWTDHVRYLDRFIERLGLRNITLVLHDHGSRLGFHYARRNPRNVRALAFFEALVRPFAWDQFSTPQFRQLFQAFRSGGVHGQGWRMIVDENLFIEQLLPQASGRPLSDRCRQYYREPFTDPASRVPIWQFARETAIGGEPPDVWQSVTEYSEWLQRSPLPKLLLYAEPGALLTAEHVDWCRASMRNLEVVDVGPGVHFLQESSPHEIGLALASWLEQLECACQPAYEAWR